MSIMGFTIIPEMFPSCMSIKSSVFELYRNNYSELY